MKQLEWASKLNLIGRVAYAQTPRRRSTTRPNMGHKLEKGSYQAATFNDSVAGLPSTITT